MTARHRTSSAAQRLLLLGAATVLILVALADAALATDRAPRVSTGDVALHAPSARPFNVFGYLPEYRQKTDFPYEDIFQQGLTHLIFFSVEIDRDTGEFKPENYADRLPQGDEWQRVRALADTYGVKLMVCLGGGGRSNGFPVMLSRAARRRAFVHALNDWVLSKELDGIDFNWEYPQSNEEWSRFGTLLLEVRSTLGYASLPSATADTTTARANATHLSLVQRMAHWRAHRLSPEALTRASAGRTAGTEDGGPLGRRRMRVREMVISMALHPHPSLGPLLQDHTILRSVDFLHWMSYDSPLQGRPHSGVDYAASTLTTPYLNSLSDAVYYAPPPSSPLHRTLGQRTTRLPPPSLRVDHRMKVTLGLPFYGRATNNFDANPEPYERLIYFIRQWVRKVHPEWREDGTEMRTMNEYGGFNYNSYADVQHKMQLARALPLPDPLAKRAAPGTVDPVPESGIAGIMIWELGQDLQPPSTQPLSLMRAVGDQLRAWAAAERAAMSAGQNETSTTAAPSTEAPAVTKPEPDTDEGDL